jgi:hypothetical protein
MRAAIFDPSILSIALVSMPHSHRFNQRYLLSVAVALHAIGTSSVALLALITFLAKLHIDLMQCGGDVTLSRTFSCGAPNYFRHCCVLLPWA